MLPTVEELLQRLGADPDGVVADELPHNRWLSPGVWRVRAAEGQRALGRAQAPFLSGRPLPQVPWLSRNFLRQYSSEKPASWDLLDDDDAWQHPVVRETFPAGLRDGVRFVHAHRERLYQISESLPRTLGHLDFRPKNLIRRPDGQVVLIDWSFAGVGAVGEDAGNLVPDSVLDYFIAALAAFTLEQVRQARQYRYGGGGKIDATFKFSVRSRVLEFNARWARQAVDLAGRLGL